MGSPQQDDFDPYSPAEIYYGGYKKTDRARDRMRTYSVNFERARNVSDWGDADCLSQRSRARRGSLDASKFESSKFLIPVDSTLRRLELQEDTDGNLQITVEDTGPKVFSIGTASSNGFNRVEIRGTYQLSNLLQEVYLAKSYGRRLIILDHARLNENPVNRLCRLIKEHFWKELTRNMGESGIELAFGKGQGGLVYIPTNAPDQHKFYTELSHRRPELGLTVIQMSTNITPEYVKSLAERPGLLALAIESTDDVSSPMDGVRFLPYVTSGRGHDKLHGWDTYFNVLGLLASDRVDLAKSSVEHMCFCIRHYGHVPQANRSYYLTRSSPPFLTDMALRVYEKIKHEVNSLDFIRQALLASIKEYHGLWVAAPRYDPATKLSRYGTGGFGIPADLHMELRGTLEKYAAKYGVSLEAFVEAYNSGSIEDPELYVFLMHERAMQESGHSDSYRFRGSCANLVTIDLNSLLYKYEKDISSTIRLLFGDSLEVPADMCTGSMPAAGYVDRSALWERRARQRKLAIDMYLWNEEEGMFFDYNIINKKQSSYESATTFWPLWAGAASPFQASKMMEQALPRFEAWGGLVTSTKVSRDILSQDRQNAHWDYPYGWAPHQVLAWSGFCRYGFEEDTQRLAYKWLSTIIKSFVDYSGIIEECYDVTRVIDPHRRTFGVNSADFKGVLRDGSAWVNASFIHGLQFLTSHQRRALGTLVSWDILARSISESSYLGFSDPEDLDTPVSSLTEVPSYEQSLGDSSLSIVLKPSAKAPGQPPAEANSGPKIVVSSVPSTVRRVPELVNITVKLSSLSNNSKNDRPNQFAINSSHPETHLLQRSPKRRRSISSIGARLPMNAARNVGEFSHSSCNDEASTIRTIRTMRRHSMTSLPTRPEFIFGTPVRKRPTFKAFHMKYKTSEKLPFKHIKLLGHGAYGIVDEVTYSGISKAPSRVFARKVILVIRGRGITVLENFRQEVSINRRLRHPHTTSLLWTYEVTTKKETVREVGMVISPVAQFNLAEFLELYEVESTRTTQEMEIKRHRKTCLERWYSCLANALAYIHSQRVRHKDIKPTNILIKDDTILIADFGFSKVFSDETTETKSTAGPKTPSYCAPEVAAHLPRNRASDIFSLGCVFAEMTTVLAGYKISDFEEMRGPPGARAFQLTPGKTLDWLVKLAHRLMGSGDSMYPAVEPVRWTWLMLNPKQELRIGADRLAKRIKASQKWSLGDCECEVHADLLSVPSGSHEEINKIDNLSWLDGIAVQNGVRKELTLPSWDVGSQD
ncbi:hypothetical protein IFR05_011208 [Cadophora sp. M221]|nr:hypothetical protein IFR05_011208 [Cadophora sp. M221]